MTFFVVRRETSLEAVPGSLWSESSLETAHLSPATRIAGSFHGRLRILVRILDRGEGVALQSSTGTDGNLIFSEVIDWQ